MNDQRGFSLVEALVSMSIIWIVLAAGVKMLASDIRLHAREEALASVDQNLRAANETLADALRSAGDGTPKTNLVAWMPWVDDFDVNPRIEDADSDTLFVARCTPVPVARLYVRVDAGSTDLDVVAADTDTLSAVIDDDGRRLILIDNREFAHVKRVSDGALQIDTDPSTTGNQGLARAYPLGTPICRVDVTEFGVAIDDMTGASNLYRDDHQGDGRSTVAEEIESMNVETADGGLTYEIQLTGRSDKVDTWSGGHIVRELDSEVTVRNAALASS